MKTSFKLFSVAAVFAAGLSFASEAAAQEAKQYISKLEVKAKETYIVGPENSLLVDTLIMHDRAVIQFDPTRYGTLEARVAIIGDKCVISAKGADGKKGTNLKPGEDGGNGGNLTVVLSFESLGKLTIDTRGGNGGAGVNGKNGHAGTQDRVETKTITDVNGKQQTITVVIPGEPGTNGTDATMGGNGGNGGNVILMYAANGFIPIFNQDTRDKNSIMILHTSGQRGRTGEPGKGGRASMDGAVKYADVYNSTDGRVDLMNLNNKAY